jgi:GH24 family phage-related lysozyme (muramidase)
MISEKAKSLILKFEGLDQPGEWPGGDSGISIGIGYDLGYEPIASFIRDWGPYLPPAHLERLKAVIGLFGVRASQASAQLRDIIISKAAAEAVFINGTIPRYEAMTKRAYPGSDKLPADAYGALVSLVYNRGTSMIGDRRREMKAIRDLVPKGDLKAIADQIRSMKRLWIGVGEDGLLARRDAEADLVESCIVQEVS